jgi:hypothetical protein
MGLIIDRMRRSKCGGFSARVRHHNGLPTSFWDRNDAPWLLISLFNGTFPKVLFFPRS